MRQAKNVAHLLAHHELTPRRGVVIDVVGVLRIRYSEEIKIINLYVTPGNLLVLGYKYTGDSEPSGVAVI